MTQQASISAFSQAIAEERDRIAELKLRQELILARAERKKLESELASLRKQEGDE